MKNKFKKLLTDKDKLFKKLLLICLLTGTICFGSLLIMVYFGFYTGIGEVLYILFYSLYGICFYLVLILLTVILYFWLKRNYLKYITSGQSR
jgi:ABC-type cobalamin transport system permease subunit